MPLIVVAWMLDLRRWQAGDFAFWLHFAGVLAFWCTLSVQDSADDVTDTLMDDGAARELSRWF